MTGGLLQLVAKGPDDVYIINDPQISFFKIVYRRHTNFCMYPNELHFDKGLDFGQTAICKLQNRGDIITQLYLEITLPDVYMKLNRPTRKEVKMILRDYSISWMYTEPDTEIVTEYIYHNEVIPVIEEKIERLVNEYNMYKHRLLYLEKLKMYFVDVSGSADGTTIINNLNLKTKFKRLCKVLKTTTENIQISSGFDLVHYILADMINKSDYYNLFIYLVQEIAVVDQNVASALTEMYLYNFDNVLNIIYNTVAKSLSVIDENQYKKLVDIYSYSDILLYNIIDLSNYNYTQADNGTDVSIFFNNVINENILESQLESSLMSIYVKQDYLNYLSQQKKIINSLYDVTKYKTDILNNIEWNIKRSIRLISVMFIIIYAMNYQYDIRFRIGLKKNFKYVSSNVFTSNDAFSLVRDTSNNLEMSDNFGDYLNLESLPGEPQGIIHFFGDKLLNNFKKMQNTMSNNYNYSFDELFMSELIIWKKLILSNAFSDTDWKNYDQLLLFDLIPIYVIDDIADFVYSKIILNSTLSKYSEKFKSTEGMQDFIEELKVIIKDGYNYDQSIKTYLTQVINTYISANDKLLFSLFMPEIFYNIDEHTSDDINLQLIKSYDSEKILDQDMNYNKLLPIEFVFTMYLIKYFEIIDEILENSQNKDDSKLYIYDLIKIFRYMDYNTVFPQYKSYEMNKYSLYNINNNYVEELTTESVSEPPYIDAACSIYYYLKKKNINNVNDFFNTSFSYNYIYDNVGVQMAKIILLYNDGIIKDINYFYNENNAIDKGATYFFLASEYFTVFARDLINYKNNTYIYEIKDIYFNKKINYYYNDVTQIENYIIEVLTNTNPLYNNIKGTINTTIEDFTKNQHLTTNEYITELQKNINNQSTTTTTTTTIVNPFNVNINLNNKDKELFNELIKKYINFYDSWGQYFEQQKLGLFNSLKDKDSVIEYMIYLITKEIGISGIYENVYYYKPTDSIDLSLVEYFIGNLTDAQIETLSDVDNYDRYVGIYKQILIDYNLKFDTDQDVIKYNEVLNSFTEVEYKKYDIVQSDVLILRIVPFYTYQELILIIMDNVKIDDLRNRVTILKDITATAYSEEFYSLIKTYENFKMFYTKQLERITDTLNKISIRKERKLNEYIRMNVQDRTYYGSELSNKLSKMVDSRSINFRWAKELGHLIIENISIELGGQVIDNYDSEWNRSQHIIFYDKNKADGYNKMIGNIPELYLPDIIINDGIVKESRKLLIPITFWFSKYYSEGLPLVAMQYTESNITVKIRKLEDIAIWNENAQFMKKPALECKILGNYIYLENDERKRICESKLEYLIEMVQRNGESIFGKTDVGSPSITSKFYFNNSSKFMYCHLKFIKMEQSKEEKINWTDDSLYILENTINQTTGKETKTYKKINPIKEIEFKFNGKNRESKKDYEYYNLVQAYKSNCGSLSDNMLIYTYAIDITKLQPSGTVNMSQINNIVYTVHLDERIAQEINNGNIIVKWSTYSYSYNILRIMSGMSGLAFYW